jgi:hypothetical protein
MREATMDIETARGMLSDALAVLLGADSELKIQVRHSSLNGEMVIRIADEDAERLTDFVITGLQDQAAGTPDSELLDDQLRVRGLI